MDHEYVLKSLKCYPANIFTNDIIYATIKLTTLVNITVSKYELTFDEVKEKLRKQGIRAPSTFTKEQLLELLNENSGQDNTVMPEIPALTQLTTSLNNMEQTVQNQGTLIQSLLVRESNIISQPAVVFQRLKEVLLRPAEVQGFVADFEQGAWKAIRKEFPTSTIKGCAFHFGQAVWCKTQELGLKTTYTSRGAEYRYIRSLMALPF
ncbi:unnamed protein product [Mytilus edulis]|uniref:MULE transposase domain-containing protein n=1 Tax=Mytilus edulis TaxID=6550 RepID=A0A8S3QUW5_MYTED|nr:unnamed protein product [Mytilus edulis]